jgi:FkbM family methyltransferase
MFKDITGIIQIGTNTGQEDAMFNSISSNKKFVYVEPIPSCFSVLQENFGNKENYKLFNCCCGNYSGQTTMYLSSNNFESSSILKPMAHTTEFPTITFNEMKEFPIRQIDSFEIEFADYNLLWIDVQGYEIEVLSGAKKCLKFIKNIYVECSNDNFEMYENCSKVSKIIELLEKEGFELKGSADNYKNLCFNLIFEKK